MPPKGAAAAAAAPELPPPLPTDVPAGGLDVPPTPDSSKPGEEEELTERFPGEFQLPLEERDRWLVLHFALPRTIMTCDLAEQRSTEAELNDVLAGMAWGTIDAETSEWVLASEQPSREPPEGESLITYAEYVRRMYPLDGMDQAGREDNERLAAERRGAFTSPGEPGARLRPAFDQVVKCLAHSNKALMKAYDIKKPLLNEEATPDDINRPLAHNIMRFGRHQILPSFWQLMAQLTKRGRRYSIVFHTFSDEQLATVQQELQLYCQGQHPAYDGKNKTQKPPPMSGEKGSRDMRLLDGCIGRVDRAGGRLEFSGRPAGDAAKTARPGEAASVAAPAKTVDSGPPPDADGEGDDGEGAPAFNPTVYTFPPYYEVYAGLQHQVLDGANTAAIVEDLKHWQENGRDPSIGHLLLVDNGDGLAETKVQHIFFDGHGRARLDVRDVVSGESIPPTTAEGLFTHCVDLVQAAVDVDYFAKAVEACEVRFSQQIIASRSKSPAAGAAAADGGDAKALPPKEYLYRNVIPALLPALEACQRDRPADPIEYIAFYMLRHSEQYSKTLKA